VPRLLAARQAAGKDGALLLCAVAALSLRACSLVGGRMPGAVAVAAGHFRDAFLAATLLHLPACIWRLRPHSICALHNSCLQRRRSVTTNMPFRWRSARLFLPSVLCRQLPKGRANAFLFWRRRILCRPPFLLYANYRWMTCWATTNGRGRRVMPEGSRAGRRDGHRVVELWATFENGQTAGGGGIPRWRAEDATKRTRRCAV